VRARKNYTVILPAMQHKPPTHLATALRQICDRQYDGNASSLARAVGVSPSTVKRWFAGMVPSSDVLARVARKAKVPITDLLGRDSTSPERSAASAPIGDRDQATAIDWLVAQGRDADQVALAASIVGRRLGPDERKSRLWWVSQIDSLMHELG
jgi:transcriptional regulator with XRE-family HTH domain